MQNNHYQGVPTLGQFRSLIDQPVTERVRSINDLTLEHFAKKSILRFGFFSVLRFIEQDRIYIKFYFFNARIRSSKREIEDFVAVYYAAEISELKYKSCNILRIPLKEKLNDEAVHSCETMYELEQLVLATLNDDSCVDVSSTNSNEGGLNVRTPAVANYPLWRQLLDDGYLEPEFEEKCRLGELDKMLGIRNPKKEQAETKTINLQIFMKTGGDQPDSPDAAAINKFFKGNYAKVWAMTKGYISTFKSYDNGEIIFDMITDPRCQDDDYMLSRFIASEYKSKVTVLAEATSYEAHHFKANDIIGYNLPAAETDKICEYDVRVKRSHNSLKAEPDWLHFGVLTKK
ncbi:MAG: hypothetical protein WKF88_07985 [Ferruginibacter sp.]